MWNGIKKQECKYSEFLQLNAHCVSSNTELKHQTAALRFRSNTETERLDMFLCEPSAVCEPFLGLSKAGVIYHHILQFTQSQILFAESSRKIRCHVPATFCASHKITGSRVSHAGAVPKGRYPDRMRTRRLSHGDWQRCVVLSGEGSADRLRCYCGVTDDAVAES